MMRSRRGAALALSLFALVAMAAIARAMIEPAMAARRSSRRAEAAAAVESAAQRALARVLGEWRVDDWRALAPGASRSSTTVDDEGSVHGIDVTVVVHALASPVYEVSVDSRFDALRPPVAASQAILVHLQPDSIVPSPALTAGGSTFLGTGTTFGRDSACVEQGTTGGLLVGPSTFVGGPGAEAITPDRSPAATNPAAYAAPAGLDLETLRAAPGVTVAPGDLQLGPGAGQSTLIVDGRLTLTGPYVHAGLVVASGGIETRGGPVTVTGAVFTGPSAPADLRAESTELIASACALATAADATARIRLLPRRAFFR